MTTPPAPSLTDRLVSALHDLLDECALQRRNANHNPQVSRAWMQVEKLLAEARATPPVGAWVPVGEAYPTDENPVLVFGIKGEDDELSVGVSRFKDRQWLNVSEQFRYWHVSHWQPLPAGPDAQREPECGVRGIIVDGEVRP